MKDQVFYEGKRLSLASQGLLPHWTLEGRRLAAVGWFLRGEKALALSIPARVTITLPEEKGHTKKQLNIPAWVTTTLPEEKGHTENNPDKKGEEKCQSE